METWKFRGMQSFKLIEIFLFFLCEGIGIALWIQFFDSTMESLEIGLRLRVCISVLVIGVPAAIFATQYTKKKIGFWSISIQGSNLQISFKQKEWIIPIEDIYSINFIEVHYGEDNRRSLHIHYQGKKLKICLPEKDFIPDISASDFEAMDDFFLYIQKSGFFVKEKVAVRNLVPGNISKSILLTK